MPAQVNPFERHLRCVLRTRVFATKGIRQPQQTGCVRLRKLLERHSSAPSGSTLHHKHAAGAPEVVSDVAACSTRKSPTMARAMVPTAGAAGKNSQSDVKNETLAGRSRALASTGQTP